MGRLGWSLLVGLLVGLQTLALAATTGPVELQFLLVNDFHGHIRQETEAPGAAKLYTTVRDLTGVNPQGTVLLGGGDMLSGTLDCNEFHGRPAIEMMNEMGFAADVAGNHAFDNDGKVIMQQARWARFPFLAANIKDAVSGQVAKPFQPSLLLTRRGIKIGVVGLTTMETPIKASKNNMVGFKFTDPVLDGNTAIRALRQQGAEVIVLLAHMATRQEQDGKITGEELLELLDKLDPVDVVLSAHSHEMVAGTVPVHGRELPVVQAGWAGEKVAVVRTAYDPEQRKLTGTKSFLQDVSQTRVKVEVPLAERLQEFLAAVDKKYRTPLAENTRALVSDRWDPYGGTCANAFTDLMRTQAGVQVVLYNGGGFRSGLPAGKLTTVNLMDVFPFNGTLYTLTLKGSDLKQAVAHGLDNEKYGFIRFSGLQVTGRVNAPEAERVSALTLSDGTPVTDDQTYTVLTNDFLLNGGDGYTMFKNAQNVVKVGSEVSFMKKALQAAGKIDYQEDGRLKLTDFGLGAAVKHHA